MNDYEINQLAAEEICDKSELNGQQFRQGDWVALLDGKVVATATGIDEALSALRSLDADPHRGMVLEVGPPPVDVIR